MSKPKVANPALTPAALSEASHALYDALNHKNDLACVLVTTSYLEDCLKTLLRQFFVKGSTGDSIFDHETHGILTDLSAQ